MLTEELTSKDQLDFATIYGTLFSLSTSIEYLEGIQGLMGERKANYVKNKALEAETACRVIYNNLEREITKRMSEEQKAISLAAVEYHKNIVYSFFILTPEHQRRVHSLINKLRKEEQQ